MYTTDGRYEEPMADPLCFVLIPVGSERAADDRRIDFDRLYTELFAPAIRSAGLEPVRADERPVDSLIHTPMLERLVLCEHALLDLTAADASVFFGLGVRHAARGETTVLTFAEGSSRLQFDAAALRAMPYRIGPDGGVLDLPAATGRIAMRLSEARDRAPKLSLFQLLEEYPNVAHEKTDVFTERVQMPERHRQEIARRTTLPKGVAVSELREYERSLGRPGDVGSAVLITLFLAYRDLEAYGEMIRLADAMPAPLARTVLMREQYAFALNRLGRGEEAEAILEQLLATRGPSSETYALLGRVYKDRYNAARKAGDTTTADAWLAQAAETYLKGFEADPRDDYPGVNAVTLLALRNRADPRLAELLPVVRYSARRRVATGRAGYWSRAALLELAVIAGDEADARAQLAAALAERPEQWKRQSTIDNLRMLDAAGAAPRWVEDAIRELGERA